MSNQLENQQDALAQNAAVTIYDRIANQKITDVESYVLMGELTKEVKKVLNKFEEETAPEISQAHKLHKALIARKKKWADKFDEAEALARLKLEQYYESQAKAGVELPKLEGISFSERWRGKVIDASLIPRQYLTADLEKLQDVTEALKEETNIPGWKAYPIKIITVKA